MKIACDIDGVLANVQEHVNEHLVEKEDWKTYFSHTEEFPAILTIRSIIRLLHVHHTICFVTGRPESNREATTRWLQKRITTGHRFLESQLLMRTNGDTRPGTEIKLEWFRKLQPDLVIDDSPETAEAATNEGFTVLQVHGFRATPNDMVPKNYLEEE